MRRDLRLERRGNEDVQVDVPEILLPDAFAVRASVDAAAVVRRLDLGDVEPARFEDGALAVLDSDDPCPCGGEQPRGRRSDVAEALNSDACAFELEADARRRFPAGDEHAATRRRDAPQ